MCRPCSSYCHSCSGPSQCVQCKSGAQLKKNESFCVFTFNKHPKTPNTSILSITILIIAVLSVALLVFLCRTHSKFCFKTSRTSYKYLASDGSITRFEDEYHDDPDDHYPLNSMMSEDSYDRRTTQSKNGYLNGHLTTSKLITSDQPSLLN